MVPSIFGTGLVASSANPRARAATIPSEPNCLFYFAPAAHAIIGEAQIPRKLRLCRMAITERMPPPRKLTAPKRERGKRGPDQVVRSTTRRPKVGQTVPAKGPCFRFPTKSEMDFAIRPGGNQWSLYRRP